MSTTFQALAFGFTLAFLAAAEIRRSPNAPFWQIVGGICAVLCLIVGAIALGHLIGAG